MKKKPIFIQTNSSFWNNNKNACNIDTTVLFKQHNMRKYKTGWWEGVWRLTPLSTIDQLVLLVEENRVPCLRQFEYAMYSKMLTQLRGMTVEQTNTPNVCMYTINGESCVNVHRTGEGLWVNIGDRSHYSLDKTALWSYYSVKCDYMSESMARRAGKLLIKQQFGGLKDINILFILISSVMEYIYGFLVPIVNKQINLIVIYL